MKDNDSIWLTKRKLVTDGLLVGIAAGISALIYRYLLGILDNLRKEMYSGRNFPSVLLVIIAAVAGGLAMGKILKWEPLSGGSGIPQIQGEILGFFSMNPLKVIAAKIAGGSIGNLFGLSLGREGPSIQIGGAAGKLVSMLLKRDATSEKYLISAGASAGLSAAFNAPLAGTMFTLEEMHKNFSSLLFIPSVTAAVTADFLSKYVFGLKPIFSFTITQVLPLKYYWAIPLCGIMTGLTGLLFTKAILGGQNVYRKLPIKKEYHPLIAVLIAVPVGYFLPEITGGGHGLAEDLPAGKAALITIIVLLMLKLIFTAVSFSSSAQGGIFLPLLVLGGLSGNILFRTLEPMMGNETGFLTNLIIIGMAGILTAVVRSPILSIVLVTEMTGSFSHILSLTIVSLSAYLFCELIGLKPIYESLLERQLIGVKKEKRLKRRITSIFRVGISSPVSMRTISETVFPEDTLIINILRGNDNFTPGGGFILRPGDEVTIFHSEDKAEEINKLFRS